MGPDCARPEEEGVSEESPQGMGSMTAPFLLKPESRPFQVTLYPGFSLGSLEEVPGETPWEVQHPTMQGC